VQGSPQPGDYPKSPEADVATGIENIEEVYEE